MVSKAKHTPGPWAISSGAEVQGPNEPVCAVNFHYVSPETVKANAHLIAAAPDLLAALEGLRAAVERRTWNTENMRAATAAIRKARGEDS